MEFSLDKMHQDKSQRKSGRTVDAIVDAIGKLMVTQNEQVPFIVPYGNRIDYVTFLFRSICVDHFKETPVVKRQGQLEIKGYTSKIIIISESEWRIKGFGYRIDPTFDNTEE